MQKNSSLFKPNNQAGRKEILLEAECEREGRGTIQHSIMVKSTILKL